MKRDPRLHGLSSDHHHALVLARTVRRSLADGRPAAEVASTLGEAFADELEPHFRIEEEALLPALAARGEPELAERTRADHEQLRALAARAADQTDVQAMAGFADALEAHVRFEEHELFPACERLLDDATLAEVARRSPPPGQKS